MDTAARRQSLDRTTRAIIGCAHAVANELGGGFLEKVYENALALELRASGLTVEQQRPIEVFYKQVLVGVFSADLLVDHEVMVELKAIRTLDEVHAAQCLNYLRATGLTLCLLINFCGDRVVVKRIVSGF